MSVLLSAPRRRVVLVDLYWTRDKDPRIPLGHASLLAALARVEGCEVVSIVEAVNQGVPLSATALVATLMANVCGARPSDVDIAFGAYVWAESIIQETLAGLRAAGFAGRIILGGPQISYAGVGLEALYPHADVFVRGYGEEALCALAVDGGRPPIRGVHYAGTEDALEQASISLEQLPSPWLTDVIPLGRRRFVRWETQRGCPYRCGFCQHREAGARLHRRSLTSARVLAEVERFCASEVDDIAVLDPIFNDGPDAIAILERFVELGFRGRLSLQCRAETLSEELLDVAAQLDVRLELGLQTIHRDESRAVQRNNNMAKVEWALSELRKRRIMHEISVIFGLPEQTLTSFEATLAWCLAREVPVIKAFPLLLLRGTPLERDRARWGLEVGGGELAMVTRSHTFSNDDWQRMAALSEALKVTEGNHPRDVVELRRIAWGAAPDLARWQPIAT